MANPNIVNVGNIYGHTAYLIPGGNATNNVNWTFNGTAPLTGLTPVTNNVNRVTSVTVANQTASAVAATVAIGNNSNYFAANLVAYPAYQISVPPNATLIVIDKTNSVYITENQSIAVSSSTANALTFTATFEAIS